MARVATAEVRAPGDLVEPSNAPVTAADFK
jgi:hypothetical protein